MQPQEVFAVFHAIASRLLLVSGSAASLRLYDGGQAQHSGALIGFGFEAPNRRG